MNLFPNFDKFADLSEGRRRNEYFEPSPTNCDYCGKSLAKEKYFIDGRERNSLQWGCMCTDCCESKGEGIGVGNGQLYLNQDGHWLLVGGFVDNISGLD
jgi:hypothetical protein